MNLENNKYVDLVFSISAIIFLIWLNYDYESIVYNDHMPTGKAAKKMAILLLILDKTMGKFRTILILSVLIAPYLYYTFKKFRNSKNIIAKKMYIVPDNIFTYENYKIHVKEITSSENGFSGKGWVEIGLVNKIKQEVEFNNLEIDENFVFVKGNIIFSEDETIF